MVDLRGLSSWARRGALRLAKSAGLFHAIAHSGWRRRHLAILTYHGVATADEHLWNPSLFLSVDTFRASLEVLRRTACNVLPLAEAVERAFRGDLPSRAVSLTFDDGNFDFLRNAMPILREFGFPATNFVSTFYVELQRPVFNPVCRYLLWKGRGRALAPHGLAEGSEPLSTEDQAARRRSFARIYEFTRRANLSGAEKQEIVALLAARLEVDLEALTAARLFHLMSADELRALPRDLIDVQLHTHRHRTPRDRELFLAEIADNRAALVRALGPDRRFTHFCYPSGDYVPEYVSWLQEAGIDLAVTSDVRLASACSHRMLLPRIAVTTGMRSLELEAWVTGARQLLPRRRSG